MGEQIVTVLCLLTACIGLGVWLGGATNIFVGSIFLNADFVTTDIK